MNKLKTAIRVTELDGFSDSLIRDFKADEKAQSDAFLQATMTNLETLSSQITTAILQDKALSTLEACDTVRDEAVKTLGSLLSAYAVFPVAEKQELALPLKAVYDKYAKTGITNASYISESSMIESLLEDLAVSSLAENIAGLDGISQAISQIRSAQDDFASANDAYVKACGSKGASASSIKKPIVSLINDKLIPYLNALVIAESDVVADFATAVETEINRINETIAKRAKKTTSSSDEATA